MALTSRKLLCHTFCSALKSHLTSGAFVHRENAAKYSAGNEGQNICGVFSETAPLQRSSAPSLGWPYIRSAIFPADNMDAHCAYASSPRTKVRNAMVGVHAVSSPCILYSFTMIILGLDRVVYFVGYRFALGISETVFLL